MSSKHKSKGAQAAAAPVRHGANDDDLDTNFKQSSSYMQTEDSGSDSDAPARKSKSKKKSKAPAPVDSDSGSDGELPVTKPSKPAAAAAAAPAKSDTSLPPVRAPAVPQKLAKQAPGEAPKQLTKQQINQIKAREKQKAEAEKKAREAAAGGAPAKPAADSKKRKQPAAAASDSDSDSDSGSDSDSEPMSKAQKASAAATPASVAAKLLPGSHLVDTTGMTEKEAKAAIIEAKRVARKVKKEARRAELEAKGIHRTQLDLQLMTRENAAAKLWELYEADRRDRNVPLTEIEADEIGRLEPRSLAQLPNHDKMEGHDFKMLYKSLKSMYGAGYQEQVLGGTIQPALSTKGERYFQKKEKIMRKEAGDEKVEEEEEEEIRQKQQHIDDPTIGAPYIVFITSSAIRAVEIGRAFKKISMNTRVVKLFAKHIKMDEQREELSHDVRVVIGTPHRLLRLSEAGYLKWNRAHLVVWDIGNDRKMFTLVTMKDTKSQLWQLYEKYLADVVVKKQTAKIVLL